MHKTFPLTAAALAVGLLLAGGPAAHASSPTAHEMIGIAREAQAAQAAPVAPAPQTPAALMHDLRAVLHHAGFQAKRAERGIPGRVDFVRSIERIDYHRPRICAHELRGFDPIGDYLSTSVSGWGAVHRTGSSLWVWRDATAAESVTLWYSPARSTRAWREARASLVIAHYTPPGR